LAVSVHGIAGLMLLLITGQVEDAIGDSAPVEATVEADHLDVLDQPRDTAYVTGTLRRGDRVRVRVARIPRTGWLAIDPLPTAICWIEESSLEHEDDHDGTRAAAESADRHDRDQDLDVGDRGPIVRAWVGRPQAAIRSGNLRARLPGPPRGRLQPGTMVQLIDLPPLTLGRGAGASRWLAIVPPPDQADYVRAEGVRWTSPSPPAKPAAEVRASYQGRGPDGPSQGRGQKTSPSSPWPPEVSAELERIDAMGRAILASEPIEQWRFETVRAGYQGLLKRAGDRRDLEEAIRTRMARVTQYEQAARAAREIESILARSHRRDRDVAQVRRRLAQSERTRARAYDAVGFVQPSARKVDGHKVFTLIGGDGSTIAYLDIPPGLDPQPLLARRVGVRGPSHFSEDLGNRLITVRDMESLEARR
jgi:hypothetical protein